ncbi:FAD-dependent oxidoreductase [Aeromicrobium phragmitis]|uniref:FAD-dependent oxidoreductase n=1 Tax=Aeromicrobium phragmitis TaxID=2478914 RepID=A0A3L8PPB0_9ACTN|nr:FAD-dependent oxidoreductase [Aeromicrobium phragmitis]RLV57226.1 FAD-dependent oxidoreductase [Aeromicrobium phragmitis]
MERIVVVGGSLAAVHAIEALRDGAFTGEIVLVGAERHLPYDRPPLSKEALRGEPMPSPLRDPEWYAEAGIRLELGTAARALDTDARVVILEDDRAISYDGLVIATGAAPRRLSAGNDHVHFLRTVDDAAVLRERLHSAKHVAVIGGGFIGLEVAATVTELGLRSTVVEVAPVPLARDLGDDVGSWLAEFHREHGVELVTGRLAVDVEPVADRYRVWLGDGSAVVADLVVAAVGARPEVDWLRSSGLGIADGVLCDRTLRASAPDVVAAGDVMRWYHPLFDESIRVEHWKNAVDQGRHAAAVLLGSDEPFAPVPYFWSDQFGASLRFVGRAHAADDVQILDRAADRLVVGYGRQGAQIGALCVNAARELAHHRSAILSRAPLSV